MGRTSQANTGRSRRVWLVGGTIVALLLIIGLAFISGRSASVASNPPAAKAPVPHFLDLSKQQASDLRTLVIADSTEQLPGTSNEQGFLMANLREGVLPVGASTGVVRSDTNCQADQDGISHCLNEIEVGSTIVTVQHHHDMAAVPCLTPGETVQFMSLKSYQGS